MTDPVKRLLDIIIAAAALVLLSPVLLLLAWQIRRKLGTPVLFRQVRPGRGGIPFVMYKFRTMRDAADENGRPLPDAASLDELPELWNVLKGDMSLVGPRPLLMEYLPLYNAEQRRRHLVRPGITGWAQVNGRNAISWPEKFRLDVWYVENRSLLLDIKILFLTVKKVLDRSGINSEGEATAAKFTGNDDV